MKAINGSKLLPFFFTVLEVYTLRYQVAGAALGMAVASFLLAGAAK